MDSDNTQQEINSSVKYRRRLDRTPDKNFMILQDADKIRLNTLRSTLEEAKSRIVRLRDENDEKDFIIEEERKLRQVAEENLQKHLVDLYNNPDVISELQQRLPRARKMYTASHEPVMIMKNRQQSNSRFDGASLMVFDIDSLTVDGISQEQLMALDDGEVVFVFTGRQEESLHHLHENSDQLSRPRQLDPSLGENYFSSRDLGQPPDNSLLDPGQDWSSLMSISQLLPPYISPNVYAGQLSPVSWSSQESSIYQGLPQRDKEQTSRSHLMTSKQILRTAATQTTPQDIPTQANSLLPDPVATHNKFNIHEPTLQFSAYSTSLPSLHDLANPSATQPVLLQPRLTPYSSHRYHPADLEPDYVSQTSRLLIEIATLKKENEELREKLTKASHEIESLNSNTKNAEDVSLNRLGSLIEEIRAAEKKRDVALKVLAGDVDEDRPPEMEQHAHVKKK
ncbi:unnamed protein product, partial [Candidula unifasciata]